MEKLQVSLKKERPESFALSRIFKAQILNPQKLHFPSLQTR